MIAPSSGRKTPVDYGVQIRFINDLCDTGGGQPGTQPKTKSQTTSKYGVAVRVQGIAGQPYVVLKDGEKGDSYGVQLRTDYHSGYSSLPRRRENAQPGTEGTVVGGGGGQGGALRRAQSHGSLLERDGGVVNEDFQLGRPPGDGKSGSYGNLDGGIGVRAEREHVWQGSDRESGMERNMWGGSYQTGLNKSLGALRNSQSYGDSPQQTNEPHSYQRQTVNKLINRFDGNNAGYQQKEIPPPQQQSEDTSPHLNPNPYTSPPSSTHSSLGRSQGSVSQSPGQSTNRWSPVQEPLKKNLTEAQVKIQSFLIGPYCCFSVSSRHHEDGNIARAVV